MSMSIYTRADLFWGEILIYKERKECPFKFNIYHTMSSLPSTVYLVTGSNRGIGNYLWYDHALINEL